MSIRVEPTEYVVCGLPEDDIDASVWQLTISRRGPDSWAVLRHAMCLSRSGRWDYEPLPSSRTDAWIKKHRFTLEEATKRAVEVYPNVVINGRRVENGVLVKATP